MLNRCYLHAWKITMSEKLIAHIDVTAEKLDELAHLAEYWKKNRERGISPGGIRAAMLMLSQEIVTSAQLEASELSERMNQLCGPAAYHRNNKR